MSLEAVIEYFSEYNIPAAGDSYSSIRLTIGELEKYSNCKELVDVCKYD